MCICLKIVAWGFPDGSVVKNLPANVGDMGSVPSPERFLVQCDNPAHAPQLLSQRPRAHDPQQEKVLQWGARMPQRRVSLRSPQLEEAHGAAMKTQLSQNK